MLLQKGFSFIETLIALILLSTTSLSLLSWQLKTSQMAQTFIGDARQLLSHKNHYETHWL